MKCPQCGMDMRYAGQEGGSGGSSDGKTYELFECPNGHMKKVEK